MFGGSYKMIQNFAEQRHIEAQQVIDALYDTFDSFGVVENVEECADSILRFKLLREVENSVYEKPVEFDQSDVRLQTLIKMLDHFESLLNK